MQIHRYEHEPHVFADSTGSRPVSANGVVLQGIHSRGTDASGSDGSLSPLLLALRQFPQTRTDAIEVARQKVASGAYLTPQAAAELAGSELRNEFFSPRP